MTCLLGWVVLTGNLRPTNGLKTWTGLDREGVSIFWN
jgi:hypothetical protein